MYRRLIVERILHTINSLPKNKVVELPDFTDALNRRRAEQQLVQELAWATQSQNFWQDEEECYVEAALLVVHGGKLWWDEQPLLNCLPPSSNE